MEKHSEFGKIAKDFFLSGESVTRTAVQSHLLEKYKVKIDIRTLKRWSVADKWEEDRMIKSFDMGKLKKKLHQIRLDIMDSDNPSAQLLYALNVTEKTLLEVELQEKQRKENEKTDSDDTDEIGELMKLRGKIRTKIKDNINACTCLDVSVPSITSF